MIMTIATIIDLEKQLTTFKTEGELLLSEIPEAITAYYQGEVTRLVLWDLRKASLNSLSSQDIQSLAHFLEQHGTIRSGGSTALVAAEDADFGMLRMGEAYADDIPFSVGVFRSLQKAQQWLKDNLKASPIKNDDQTLQIWYWTRRVKQFNSFFRRRPISAIQQILIKCGQIFRLRPWQSLG
jgi:hypothetical protein